MNPAVVTGVQLNSALYLAAVLVGGIYFHNALAIKLDIAAIGATYVSYLFQTFDLPVPVMWAAVIVSMVFGAAAGIALL